MIIKCTTLEQVKRIVEVEGWTDWVSINYKDCTNYINKFRYVCVKIIDKGEYGQLNSWRNAKNDDFIDFADSKYSEERHRMKNIKDLDVTIQVDVNTKKIMEALKDIKKFEVKEAILLLQSQGYKVEAPYQEPTDEEIVVRINAENKKVGYVPDWNNSDEHKYEIMYSHSNGKYTTMFCSYISCIGMKSYTTKEIAEKIVMELNEKRFVRI